MAAATAGAVMYYVQLAKAPERITDRLSAAWLQALQGQSCTIEYLIQAALATQHGCCVPEREPVTPRAAGRLPMHVAEAVQLATHDGCFLCGAYTVISGCDSQERSPV